MKLFEYKPTEYVDVHPDLPLEWMQQEIDKTQNKYDAKLGVVNDLNKQFADMQAGAQTQEELQAINNEYSKKINDMVSGLTNTGYIPQTSADLAKFINEVSFDPRVKKIKEDREAYEIYQKNKLDPQYAGGVDMLDYYKPGMPYDPNLYKIIPASDSVAKSRTVAQTMHPSTIDGGKTWNIKDPFSGQTITRNSYSDAVGVSKERIKAYTDYNYVNWKTDPDSYADRVKLSGNNMAFWDTPEGKAVYDEKMRALEPLAYQTDTTPKTGTQGTKPAKPPKSEEEKDKIMNAQPGVTLYGDKEGFGLGHDGNKVTDYFGVIEEEKWNKMEYLNTSNEINKLTASGIPSNDPRIIELQKRKDKAKNDTAVWDTWRHKVENELYGKMNPGDIAIAQEEAKALKERAYLSVQKSIMAKFPWLSLPIALTEIWPSLKDGIQYGNADLLMQALHTNAANAKEYLDQYDKEWKKALEGTPSGEIVARYDKYKDYQTSGMSYVVPEDKKNQVGTLVKSLLNKGSLAKDVVSDNQVNAKLQQQLFESLVNEETGEWDFDRLSPEILLDEKDGPVLVIHGFRDEDGGVIGLEYNLQDTPGIRDSLYDMLPEDRKEKMTLYVEATQSLKKSGRKKGEFTIPRYDRTNDVIEFTRHPIQGDPGKWEYLDSDKNKYASINDLIDAKGAETSKIDSAMKMLEEQRDIAYMNGNDEEAIKLHEDLTNLVVKNRIERGLDPETAKPMTDAEKKKYESQTTTSSTGKQQPQTQSNSLRW
jgi:hypothetical protein